MRMIRWAAVAGFGAALLLSTPAAASGAAQTNGWITPFVGHVNGYITPFVGLPNDFINPTTGLANDLVNPSGGLSDGWVTPLISFAADLIDPRY